MKELFSVVFVNLKKDSQFWILSILTYTLLMTIGSSVSYALGFMDLLLIIFIVCPFIMSFIKLAAKSIENETIDHKDVYTGYRELSLSIMIFFKRLLKIVLFTLLVYFLLYMGLAFVDIIFFEQELIENLLKIVSKNSANIDTQVFNVMMNNDGFINRLLICNYIAIGLTMVFFNLFANKKLLSIIFHRIFCVNDINYDYIVNNKKEIKQYKLWMYNLFISLFYVSGLVFAILTNKLLINLTGNMFISYLFSSFIFFIVSSVQIPFKYIGYTYIFENNFEGEVMKMMKELGRKS